MKIIKEIAENFGIKIEEFKTTKDKVIAVLLFIGVAAGVFVVGYVLVKYFHLK